MDYKKELIIRSIKMLDIGYINAIYLLLGIILAKLCDEYFGKFNKKEEDKKPIWKSVLELILYLWFIGVVVYIVRNLVELIPFPLNGVYGFDHHKVKELTSGATFAITFIYFQQHYQDKIKYIFERIKLFY